MVVIRLYIGRYYQVVFIPTCVKASTEVELLPKGFNELEPLGSKVDGLLFFCCHDVTEF